VRRGVLVLVCLWASVAGMAGPRPCEVRAADPPKVAAKAGDPAIDGPKQVAPYKLVRLEVTNLPDGAVVFWDVSPEAVVDIEEVNGRAILTAPAGSYAVKARVVRNDAGKLRSQTLRHRFVIGEQPPEPAPTPTPKPPEPKPPEPTPQPVPVTSFRVLFIVERMANLTPGQNAVVHGAVVERFLDDRTTRTDNTRGWRRIDPHANTDGDTPTMNALWASVKPSITAVPCVAVEVNGKVEVIPLEETPAKMVAKLRSYLGEK